MSKEKEVVTEDRDDMVFGETINPNISAMIAEAERRRGDKNVRPVGFWEHHSDYE